MALKALAPAPSRANTTITFSMGLITIPLSVHTGVEETRVARKEFTMTADGGYVEVGRSPIRKDTGEVLDSASVTRMAQADNGSWATLDDDEIAACTSPKGLAEVVCFVPNTKVNQYLVQDVKQVRPRKEKGKENPAYEKAFALVLAGLKASKVHALIKVAMRGPARYALLDQHGNLFLVATADQVRQPIPSWVFNHTAGEISMVRTLIDAVGIDAPVLTDDTAPVVKAYVNAKAAGAPKATVVQTPAIEVDIMAQLSASIDAQVAANAAGKGKVA